MRKQDIERWQRYFDARNQGISVEQAARKARLSPSTAYRFERGDNSSGGLEAAAILGITMVGGNLVAQPLVAEAQQALDDFAYFRIRYFGRKSLPWQERAAYEVLRSLQSKEREYIVMNEPPGSGKALALDTPLPTPTGWTTMGEVQPGDWLIGGDGKPVLVVAKTDVMYGHDCYEIRTDDGHSVIADAEHLWPATIGNRPTKDDYPGKSGPKPSRLLYTSKQLARKRSKRPQLATVAVDLPETTLPIDPWVLGAWLGDGSSASGRMASHQDDQPHMRSRFESAGYTTTDIAAPQAFGVLRLQTDLRHLGVLNNKHVPTIYLRSSIEQRRELLRGLIDTDGYVDPTGRTEFTTTNQRLASDVVELVCSLGIKASCMESRATLNGRDCGPKWRIAFALDESASLPRKAHGRATRRPRYLDVLETDSVPVACIQVANPDGLYLAGKGMLLTHNSTLFTHDIPCWLIARDRTIRIQIGSRTERQARMYVGRIKRSLERDAPLRADIESLEAGISFDATACLQDDFGAFKPEGRTDLWRAEALVVRQLDGIQLDDKEPTVSAWGQDSGFLGGRFDFVLWDDLADRKNTKSVETRDQLREWWDSEAETRLEPGGTLLLQGQRITHDDLYRYCLDKKTMDEQPKYRHVVFKAHDTELCTQQHDSLQPWPKSCLLDPYRLPWTHLETLQHNNPRNFEIMYQQADGDVIGGLVDPVWITGGVDGDGYPRPGCLDRQRTFLDPPEHLLDGNGWSFITVDPSPTEWWGIIWWLYDPDSGNRYIIDLHRRRMNPEEFISLDLSTFEWSGLIPDLYKTANDMRIPITHVIVEVNAAQRWLLSQPHVQKWIANTGMVFVPHTTSINKQDPKYGLESIGDLFRQGMIRVPWGDFASRTRCQHLIEEATKYPDYETTDLIMSVWFGKLAVENHYSPKQSGRYHLARPSWMGYRSRGLIA